MRERARYRFVNSPFILGLFALAMLASSFFIISNTVGLNNPERIIFLNNIIDTGMLDPQHSALIMFAIILLTSVTLYAFNLKTFSCGKPNSVAPLLYVIFVLTPPDALIFSGAAVAAPLVLTSVYISLFTKDNDRNLVLSVFLISLATLFDSHLVLIVPLILYYSLQSSSFNFRNIVLAVVVLALPYIFIIFGRDLAFGDDGAVMSQIVSDLKRISAPVVIIKSPAGVFLVVAFMLVIYRAVISAGKYSGTYKILKSAGVSRNVILMILLGLISLLYPESQPSLFSLLSVPLALIVAEYTTNDNTSNHRRAEFFVLLIMIAINRIADFM